MPVESWKREWSGMSWRGRCTPSRKDFSRRFRTRRRALTLRRTKGCPRSKGVRRTWPICLVVVRSRPAVRSGWKSVRKRVLRLCNRENRAALSVLSMEDKPLPGKLLIEARNLSQRYIQRQSVTGKTLRIQALDRVDISIAPGASLALVGQSGSGKSTLARCLMRLEEPSEGEIWFEGRNLLAMSRTELFAVRRRMQLILQDPASAFNPRLDAAEIVAEPLLIQGLGTREARHEKALHFIQK